MPDLATSLSYCTYCPKLCRHTCPVSNATARETLVPQHKMAQMRRLGKRETPRTVEESEPLYGCTGCGACTEFCQHKVEVGSALFRGRDEAERDGRGDPALYGFVARFDAHGKKAASQTRQLVPSERRPLEAQVAFVPPCEEPTLAPEMLALCDRIGAEYVGVAELPVACGGYPLLAAGQHDAFRLHAERTAEALRGYARVVMHCPACAFTMKTQYRSFGVPLRPQIEHTTEFLEGFATRLPIKRTRPVAYYHDPCYLGRHLGLYDPPRQLAGRALDELREFSRAREESECSGGGGLLPLTMPEAADAISAHRVAEVREAGVQTVVTSCASCKRRLGRDGVRAVDLIELLADATR
jgi:Fe-S oxidoreductase